MKIQNKWDEEFEVEVGDLIACYPYRNAFYEVYNFNLHSDINIVSVIEGTAIVTLNLDDIVSVKAKIKEDIKSQTSSKKRRSRITDALQQDHNRRKH